MCGSGQSAFTPLENCTIAPKLSTTTTLAFTFMPGLTSECVNTEFSKALAYKAIIKTKKDNSITTTKINQLNCMTTVQRKCHLNNVSHRLNQETYNLQENPEFFY